MKTKTTFLFALMCCFTSIMHAQVTTKKQEAKTTEQLADESIYNAVEKKPEFPGGMQKFYEYVANSYTYPKKFKGTGKIYMQFIVEKDGTLSNIKILRDLGHGTGDEAARVLKASPKWQPGMQNGKAVRVLYSLPISLQDKK
ncbi:MAG: energy transducer TonB [Flavobacterium sp.]|nr:energy transducer TonB [Flavobacterium sp.]